MLIFLLPLLILIIQYQFDLDVPTAHRKVKKSCPLHLHNFLFYAHLSPQNRAFVSFIDSHSIPKSVSDVMSNSGWRVAMKDRDACLRAK